MKGTLVLCMLLAMLAGCGQLPKPFQPDGRENVIGSLTRQATIHVLPMRAGEANTPRPNVALMAQAMASALSNQGLLTTVEEPEGPTRRLSSTLRLIEQSDLHDVLQIDWTLYEYEGTVLGNYTQRARVLRVAWTAGNAVIYSDVAQAAAPEIASFLARRAPEESRIAGWPGAKLVVLPVDGAGEEGNAAMTRAMIRQLKIADYPVEPEPNGKNLLITGSLAITGQSDGTDLVTVIWRVLKPDGGEIGVVEQSNRVEAGSLQSNWNRSAGAIAGAAAPGIIDLLEQSSQEGY